MSKSSSGVAITHPEVNPEKLINDLVNDALYQEKTGQLCTPIFIWGQPGIGKSQIVRQVGKETGRPVIDIRLLLKDPTDIGGLPYFDPKSESMKYARPCDLPDPNGEFTNAIILMDELSSAPATVQAAALGLVLERSINEYKLPDGVMIIAAGNRATDGTVHTSMPQPLRNRFAHVTLTVKTEDWLKHAMVSEYSIEVQSFIKAFPDELNKFKASSSEMRTLYAYATPRSWEFASNEIAKYNWLKAHGREVSKTDLYRRLGSIIGIDTVTTFRAHYEQAIQLPDPRKIVRGEIKEVKVESTSMKYALSLNVAAALKAIINEKLAEAEEGKSKFMKAGEDYNKLCDNALRFLHNNIQEKEIVVSVMWLLSSKEYAINLQNVDIIEELTDDDEYSSFLNLI